MSKHLLDQLRNGIVSIQDYEVSPSFSHILLHSIIKNNKKELQALDSTYVIGTDNNLITKVKLAILNAYIYDNPRLLKLIDSSHILFAHIQKSFIPVLLDGLRESNIVEIENDTIEIEEEGEERVLTGYSLKSITPNDINNNLLNAWIKQAQTSKSTIIILNDLMKRHLISALQVVRDVYTQELDSYYSDDDDIFHNDLCWDCKTRLIRKYGMKNRRMTIPNSLSDQRDFSLCAAYIIAFWEKQFRSPEEFYTYAERIGELLTIRMKKKGIDIKTIKSSSMRKIINRLLEISDRKFLEKHAK